jgi:hypothetical protein
MVEVLPILLELLPMVEALHTLTCQQLAHHGFHHQLHILTQMVKLLFIHMSQPQQDLRLSHKQLKRLQAVDLLPLFQAQLLMVVTLLMLKLQQLT